MGEPLNLVIQDLYKNLDAVAELRAMQLKATCAKGCSHCCYLLATASFVEALYIADELLQRPDWRDWLPKLNEAAKKFCYPGVNKRNYFNQGIPCVFLKDSTCVIYDKRPEACRYHYVASPPGNCSHRMPENTGTAIINMMPLSEKVWELNALVIRQLTEDFGDSMPAMLVGPIPIVILWAMTFLIGGGEDKEFVRSFVEGIPMPLEWVTKYADPKEMDPSESMRSAREMSEEEVLAMHKETK
jgi:Fe-S-cluster containining protein